MKTTEQQREELEALKLQLMDNMSSISKDFAFDYRADCGAWVCDAFTEYADNAISVYTRDQLDYFNENSEECENALLSMYDGDSLADIIKSEGLTALCAKYDRDVISCTEEGE